MTVRVNKSSFNIREKLSELGRKFGLKGSELVAAETVQEARDLVSAGRRNVIINGNFDIWERGTSTTGALSNAYGSADRWMFHTRSLTTRNISRQAFTNGQTDVPGNPIYYLRFEASNDSGSYGAYMMQRIEDVRVGAGEDVTVSFYAKTNSGGGTFETAFSQQFGSGGSGATDNVAGSFTPTSSWKKYSFTVNLPSISGKTIGTNNYLRFDIRFPSNTAVTLDVAQVQVERGRNATDFEHRSYGEELALCQRYFRKFGTGAQFIRGATGTVYSSAPLQTFYPLIPDMRATPTGSNAAGGTTVTGQGFTATYSSSPGTHEYVATFYNTGGGSMVMGLNYNQVNNGGSNLPTSVAFVGLSDVLHLDAEL